MISMNDIWMADLLLISVYGFYVVLLIFLLYSLYRALQTFRGRVSWGKARIMGIPFSLFLWLQFIFYLVLVDATYSVVSLLLWAPLWVDLAVALGIIALTWWSFWRLSKRPTFKRQLFISLVMVPLGIPGLHVIGQVAQTGTIEISQKVGIGVLRYSDSLEGLAIKNVDTIVEAIPIVRHFPLTMKTVAGEITFINSFEKGLLGDAITAKRITALGYSKLPSKYNAINGIDGIFVKRDTTGVIVELIIVENKVDSSRLALKQMSDEWLFGRIEKMKTAENESVTKTGEILYNLLLHQPQLVRKELWQHDLKNGSTVVRSVTADGKPGTILRSWSDTLIKNQLVDRCRRQIYVCN